MYFYADDIFTLTNYESLLKLNIEWCLYERDHSMECLSPVFKCTPGRVTKEPKKDCMEYPTSPI